jgi:hypothetical protein
VEIRLTAVQFQEIERQFGRELRYHEWFARAEHRSPKTVDVTMPAIGWLRLRDQIASVAFNMRGQRNSKAPRHLSRALTRIARALADLHIHPALEGVGMTGIYGQVIPAWTVPGQKKLSEFPVIDGEFCVLYPQWGPAGGLPEVTFWQPSTLFLSEMPLLREAEHLAFGIYERTP